NPGHLPVVPVDGGDRPGLRFTPRRPRAPDRRAHDPGSLAAARAVRRRGPPAAAAGRRGGRGGGGPAPAERTCLRPPGPGEGGAGTDGERGGRRGPLQRGGRGPLASARRVRPPLPPSAAGRGRGVVVRVPLRGDGAAPRGTAPAPGPPQGARRVPGAATRGRGAPGASAGAGGAAPAARAHLGRAGPG